MAQKGVRLGELLLRVGLIDEFQLDSALSHQRNCGGRLGNSLVKLGYLPEERLLEFLARQMKLQRVDLAGVTIPPRTLSFIPAPKARRYNVLPLGRKDDTGTPILLVAMTDPTNLRMIDDLQFLTGFRVRPVLSTANDIKAAIERCYGPEERPSTTAPEPKRADCTEEKFQRLLKILRDKGILSPWDIKQIEEGDKKGK